MWYYYCCLYVRSSDVSFSLEFLKRTHTPTQLIARSFSVRALIAFSISSSLDFIYHALRRVKKRGGTLSRRSFTFSVDLCKANMLQIASPCLLYSPYVLTRDYFLLIEHSCELKEMHSTSISIITKLNISYSKVLYIGLRR